MTSPSETLGKTAGKDSHANKPTYVSVLGLESARAQAQALRARAHQALRSSGLGHIDMLAALADRVVDREH